METLSDESWTRHININLRAPLLLTQAFAAQIPENTHGNVINLLDQLVWRLIPTYVSYTASKSALWTLTQTLAMALAPKIRVNLIGPGQRSRMPNKLQKPLAPSVIPPHWVLAPHRMKLQEQFALSCQHQA